MTHSDLPLPYLGQVAALATKHGKREQLAPALSRCGLDIVVADVDTDAFGTFTGDVPRRGTPLEVAVRKARAGMAVSASALGLASEGSFGPHPAIPLLVADVELVVLVDDLHGMVVAEQVTSLDTVARTQRVAPGEDTSLLRDQVGFPAQALVCRPADGSVDHITKGITDTARLERAVLRAARASSDGHAVIETDLRADRCPTRRGVIAQAAERLAERLASRCPACEVPGFGEQSPEPGLPCALCAAPTRAPTALSLTCPGCGHRERHHFTGVADPATCERCNP